MPSPGIEAKAGNLVLQGRVEVECARFDEDGRLLVATGTVESSDGTERYRVQLAADFGSCTCRYGQDGTRALPADSHSHDVALRIAAQIDHERSMLNDHQDT